MQNLYKHRCTIQEISFWKYRFYLRLHRQPTKSSCFSCSNQLHLPCSACKDALLVLPPYVVPHDGCAGHHYTWNPRDNPHCDKSGDRYEGLLNCDATTTLLIAGPEKAEVSSPSTIIEQQTSIQIFQTLDIPTSTLSSATLRSRQAIGTDIGHA